MAAWLLLPAAASAEPPSRLPQPITDTAGVLDDADVARIQEATNTLYDEHGLQLWVTYVSSFDGRDYDSWAQATAQASNFGPDTALLAVATDDREFALWTPTGSEISESERDRIERALGERARRVDHIGSTSVPGLAARPIVDVQLQLDDPDDEFAYVPALQRAGYQLRVREPGHRMLRTPARDVQVHVCGVGSPWAYRHLAFRDWLRMNAADRQAYAELKRELAGRDWPSMRAYADARGPFVDEVLTRAEAWALHAEPISG